MDASRHDYGQAVPKIYYFTGKMVPVLLLPVGTLDLCFALGATVIC